MGTRHESGTLGGVSWESRGGFETRLYTRIARSILLEFWGKPTCVSYGVNCQDASRDGSIETLEVTLQKTLTPSREEALAAAGKDDEEVSSDASPASYPTTSSSRCSPIPDSLSTNE